jgi:hypothetical protein
MKISMKMKTRRTRTSKKKMTTRRIGSSVIPGFLLLFGLFTVPGSARKKEKEKEKDKPAPHALIAGTTFRPPGFALPGSRVRIEPRSAESGGVRLKPAESVTDSRGEFAVRVPVVPMEWTVHVHADGYHPQARTVSVDGEQRVDLSFVLEPVQRQSDRGEGK